MTKLKVRPMPCFALCNTVCLLMDDLKTKLVQPKPVQYIKMEVLQLKINKVMSMQGSLLSEQTHYYETIERPFYL